MSVSGIYALTNQTTTGSLSTGIVDIKLDDYTLNVEGEEVILEDPTLVSPGESVSLIPKINNLGEKCYLRIKLSFKQGSSDYTNKLPSLSTDWIPNGEYFYYNKALDKEEVVTVFNSITIPDTITETSEDVIFRIDAEAIQEKNFEPDYDSTDPWLGVTPDVAIDNSYNMDTNHGDSKITIKYENKTDEDVHVPSDFLERVSSLMPGDSMTEQVDIKNLNKRNAKFFMTIKISDEFAKEKELLGLINLTIKNKNGDTLYSGKFVDITKLLLGKIDINGTEKIELEISVPSELGNEYTKLNPVLDIYFLAEYENPVEGGGGSSETLGGATLSPKTGDSIDLAITMFLISSLGLIIVIILAYKERKKENIDSNIDI